MYNIVKAAKYSVTSNLFAAIISVLMVLILPKFMSIEDYGYWQLYLFYLSYVGFFHFGLINGIHVRYAGMDYSLLDKKMLSGQLYALVIFDLIIALAACLYVLLTLAPPMVFILSLVSIVGLFVLLSTFSSFILQSTAQISEYSKLIMFERLIFSLGIVLYVIFGGKDFLGLIWISLFSRFTGMLYGGYLIKDIVVAAPYSFRETMSEVCRNISVGIKIMLANIASMFILGIARFGISQGWDIETFGKVSLALSISNFMMIFISALSVVLFPMIKNMDTKQRLRTYKMLKNSLSLCLLSLLCFYYPLYILLLKWLPKYADSLQYIVLLMPICIFESKITLLTNTYLQSFRKEKLMLIVNIIAVALILLLTLIGVKVLYSLNFVLAAILLTFVFRYMFAEYFLSTLMGFDFLKDNISELCLVAVFTMVFQSLNGIVASCIYICSYLIYLFSKKADIINLRAQIVRYRSKTPQ